MLIAFWLIKLFPTSLFAQTILIDPQWLASRTPPYRLSDIGSNYVLSTNVTTAGTAFLFNADAIVLDLNGHTITYADLDFTGIKNPGFEKGSPHDPSTPEAWDLSKAPHARRQNYLDKLFFDDWSLRMENPAGDAYEKEYIRSSEVYLPAAGRYAAIAQVKGGPYRSVEVKLAIEGISVTPDNKISNMPMVYQGTDMSIGIIAEFNVDAPCHVRLRVVLGTKNPSVSTAANIDEVDIRPIGRYGIALEGWNRKMAEIRNGTIQQGRSKAVYSPAIHRTGAAGIHNLTIVTNGINCPNISEVWAGGLKIYNNHMEAHGKLPLHRHYPFAMIDLGRTPGGNEIYGNTLLYGPHFGINHGNARGTEDNPFRSRISHNTIRTRVVATNGFAVSVGSNVDVISNTIQPVQGHGIGLGKGSNHVRIQDNLIEPSTWPCSEYSRYSYPNSAHGIRMKTYGNGNLRDVHISGNRIVGKTNPQKENCYTEVVGITNYVTDSDPEAEPNPTDITIHDNRIQVTTDNHEHQHAIAYKAGPCGEVFRNTFASNHVIVEMSDSDAGAGQNAKMISNIFEKLKDPSGFHTLRFGYNRPYGNVLLDTKLLKGADLKDILHTRNYSKATDLTVSWFLNVKVSDAKNGPVVGATVAAYDKTGKLAEERITNASGEAIFELKEYTYYYDSSPEYRYFSPYRIEISSTSYPRTSRVLILDHSTELVVVLGKK